MAHILLLNSGGLDTLYCARTLKAAGHNLHSVFVAVGNTADEAAAAAAQQIADATCVDHHTLQIKGLRPVQKVVDPPLVGIPYQTQIVFMLAASLCLSFGVNKIATGIKAEVMGYADQKLYDLIAQTYFIKWPVQLICPAADMNPFQVMEALRGDPLLSATQSCNQVPSCFESKPDRRDWCFKCQARNIYGID